MLTFSQTFKATVLVSVCCAILDLGGQPGLAQTADPVIAYRVGRLWPGTGAAVDSAVLIVSGGRIVAAGPESEVSVPPGATVVDRSSCVMIPGLVLAESSVGKPAADELSVTPQFRAADGLDLFEEYPRLLAAGVTTVHVNPGTERILPGQSSVMKLHGEATQRLLREVESLQVILTGPAFSPPTVYEPPIGANSEVRPLEPTRPQLASSLAEAVVGLRALLQASQTELPETLSARDRELLETMAAAFEKKLPVRVSARTANEIQAARQLLNEFGLSAVLVNPEYLSVSVSDDELASFGGFVLFPDALPSTVRDVSIPDPDAWQPDRFWELAAWLRNRQRLSDVALGGLNEREMESVQLQAATLKRAGLSTEEILGLLTANAAKLLGVEDRVGSLTVGKDADFVLLSGDPFDRDVRVMETVVNGQVAFSSTGESTADAARPRIIRAGALYTPEGVVQGGALVIQGGKIAAAGADVSLPLDADIDDYSQAVIIPGLIDLNSEFGLGAPLSDRVELNVKLGDQLISEDRTVEWVRGAGITTAIVGSSRLPSPLVAFKLTDQPRIIRDPVALRFEVSGNLTNVAESLKRSLGQGKAYADSWTKYETALAEYQTALKAYEAEMAKIAAEEAKAKAEAEAKAKAAAEAKAKSEQGGDADSKGETSGEASQGEKPPSDKPQGEKPADAGSTSSGDASRTPNKQDGSGEATQGQGDSAGKDEAAAKSSDSPKGPEKPKEPTKPREVPNLEPYRAVFAGELPVVVVANEVRAIELAVKLFADEFGLETIIAGAKEADLALSALRHEKIRVAVGPELMAQRESKMINLPQRLATGGIPFGFQSNAASGSSLLPSVVAAATYRGLGTGDALRAFSSGSADMLKLGSVGKLAAGYDADLVVLSGPPFDLGTKVLAVMIDGQWVSVKESK